MVCRTIVRCSIGKLFNGPVKHFEIYISHEMGVGLETLRRSNTGVVIDCIYTYTQD